MIDLKNQGYIISGSDDSIYEPSKSNLFKAGILPKKEGWFPEKIESFASRESGFLYNNVVFISICATILWGTMYPLISEYFNGIQIRHRNCTRSR